jgi:hypothetical protein
MPSISINLDLIDSDNNMDKIINELAKSSIKSENDYGFKTPRKMIKHPASPPSIKNEYFKARIKRSRASINLNELGFLSDEENQSPKVKRIMFPNLSDIEK